MPGAYLPNRSLIRVSGAQAQEFLQALITTDVDSLPESAARPGALLTPQGKILFDFIIWRDEGGFLIEIDTSLREAFVKRLTIYKLRAAVEISVLSEDGISVFWGDEVDQGRMIDLAFEKAGVALKRSPGRRTDGAEADYHTLRIACGIAQSGKDYALQDAFPHDILLDKTDGLSFRKGCYVGQEVVSRMQHRGTARRRLALISAQTTLPISGTDILAGEKPAGMLGSVSGHCGLGIIRIDRVSDALASGMSLTANGVAIDVTLPEWTGLTFPSEPAEGDA